MKNKQEWGRGPRAERWRAGLTGSVLGMVLWAGAAHGQLITVDFADVPVAEGSYFQLTAGESGVIATRGVELPHTTPAWGGFSDFTVSRMTDTTTAGFGNPASAITGTGVSNDRYGVVYALPAQTIGFTHPGGAAPQSIFVTNTTWAFLSMRDGDAFSKQFGGADGTDEDWFKVTFEGILADDSVSGSVQFYLADFRGGASNIVDSWQEVDLTGLGSGLTGLRISLASTDVGDWGMNTPAYVAFDNLTIIAVPEPSVYAAWLGGLALLAVLWRRRKKD